MEALAHRLTGLASLKDAARYVYITSAEPTTYLEASSTFALGSKDLGAGGVFPAAIAAGTNGRKLTTAAFDDGSVTGTGTVFNWAITDASNLLVVDALSVFGHHVTSGNFFGMGSVDLVVKSQ